jgi:NAD(P)H-nitrite reductase large subunit
MAGPKHVILGAGTAGFNAITTLLSMDPQADVTWVAAERPYARMVLPYYLASHITEDNVYTIAPQRLREKGVTVRLGERAEELDRANKVVRLTSGYRMPYDDLLIATGSSATRPPLPGIMGANIYDHWTLNDTEALRRLVGPGKHIAMVGAGFIGFTLVNPLLDTGVRLTLVEREPQVLPRMLNATAAGILQQWLTDRGVEVLVGAELQSIEDGPNGAKQLNVSGRAPIEADAVIVATGIKPNIDWLQGSGLNIGRAIVVDKSMRTNDPSIYAAGDVAEIEDAITGERTVMAIETAAMEQGRLIGAAMAGKPREYTGGMLMNVIEAAGLQAASFGAWAGTDATEGQAAGGHYRRYVWNGDRLVGGVLVGPARQVAGENDMGLLKGLVQSGQPLGEWKQLLVERPFELKKVYLATRTVERLLPRTLLGEPSVPLETQLAGAHA